MTSKTGQSIPLEILPGVVRNVTPEEAINRYIDGNNIRFREGRMEKIGGYASQLMSGSFLGVPRSNITWQSLDEVKHQVIGTHSHLYVAIGGQYFDITPIRDTSSLVDAITTVNLDSVISIEDSLHGADVGDFILFPSPVTYNGVTVSGEYEIINVIDQNNYEIETNDPASASGTGGGSFDVSYLLPSGLADSGIVGSGWGVGPWGEEEWGTPRSSGVSADARLWVEANWGEDILALPIGGKLYFWDTSVGVGTRAQEVTDAPERSNYMIVASFFRQAILFGTEDILGNFDPMLIRWSGIEDYTEFTPTNENSAGEYRLTKGTKIISAIETRNGEILVFTDTAVYKMRPASSDDVYEVVLVGDSSGIIAPFACVDIDGIVYWMSPDGFRLYDGAVRIIPCTLDLFYFDRNQEGAYNIEQSVKIFVGSNNEFNELWFFLPDKDNIEINRYIIYNYKDEVWSDGLMQRTCWEDRSTYDKPFAYDRAGALYSHETGRNADNTPMSWFAQTCFYDITDADKLMFCDRVTLSADLSGLHQLDVIYKKFPNTTEIFTKQYNFTGTTPFTNIRVRGRHVSLKFSNSTANSYYRQGKIWVNTQEDGER